MICPVLLIVNNRQRSRAQVEQFSLFINNTLRQKGMQFSQFIHKRNAIYIWKLLWSSHIVSVAWNIPVVNNKKLLLNETCENRLLNWMQTLKLQAYIPSHL